MDKAEWFRSLGCGESGLYTPVFAVHRALADNTTPKPPLRCIVFHCINIAIPGHISRPQLLLYLPRADSAPSKNGPDPFPGRMSRTVRLNRALSESSILSWFLTTTATWLRSVILCFFFFTFCRLMVLVSISASDWLERLVSEMTYNVLMGTLNPTHSLTHSLTHCVVYL